MTNTRRHVLLAERLFDRTQTPITLEEASFGALAGPRIRRVRTPRIVTVTEHRIGKRKPVHRTVTV